jgi:predicted chitinase
MAKRKAKYRVSPWALRRVCPSMSLSEAFRLSQPLGAAMRAHGITTQRRATMFIAQLAHESGEFRWREELASGAAYEGRRDLGNIFRGDGVRYKGRAFIQITGRANYAALPHWGGVNFEANPSMLSWRRYAALASAWWWKNNGCNQLADGPNALLNVTRRINGGFNGLDSRRVYFERASSKRNASKLTPRRRFL